jgi:hypothetical protein
MANLTTLQRDMLLKPINPKRVLRAQGQSHLPAFDVEAHLTRIFGYEGWDREILDLWCIAEDGVEKGGRIGWTVTYGCKLRLTVRNPDGEVVKTVDGCATGSANNLPSKGDAHDFAMKNADSYALKRCAKALADQFGLSLYNKGSVKALVQAVIAYDQSAAVEIEPPTTMGNDERQEDTDAAPIEDHADAFVPATTRRTSPVPGPEPVTLAEKEAAAEDEIVEAEIVLDEAAAADLIEHTFVAADGTGPVVEQALACDPEPESSSIPADGAGYPVTTPEINGLRYLLSHMNPPYRTDAEVNGFLGRTIGRADTSPRNLTRKEYERVIAVIDQK